MKKTSLLSVILAVIICSLAVLPSCGGPADDPRDTSPSVTEDTGGGGTEAPGPGTADAKHEISISEASSMLAANGLRTNTDKFTFTGGAYHGGQQMRAVRTERGTYAAFAKDFGDADELQKFYVAKVDADGRSALLYYGQFLNDDAEVTVNIGHDTVTGDIVVTATSDRIHTVYIFDAATDAVTSYSMEPEFRTENVYRLNYSNVLFDFDRRYLCVLSTTSSGTNADTVGDDMMEWFTFDLDSKEWAAESVAARVPDIGRHGYNYLFPDGNGGAYIAGERNEYSIYAGERFSLAGQSYIWDRIDLFHIPDMKSSEGIAYVPVQEEDDSLGLEGIWSNAPVNQYGDSFIDDAGYIHITYKFELVDYAGGHEPFDKKMQYRHAVYDSAMNLVFNEPIELPKDYPLFRFSVRQGKDGALRMLGATVSDKSGEGITLYFYNAQDELGRTWKLEKTYSVGNGIDTDSLSFTGRREGSVRDGKVTCFIYGYQGFNSTAFVFDIDLDDFSVSEPVDLLEGYGVQIDDRADKRIPAADSVNTVIAADGAAYSAFVYNFSHTEDTESYCIMKTDRDGSTSLLYSGSFNSNQDKYLSVSASDDGLIYVFPPTGNTAVIIDPADGSVTEHTFSMFYPMEDDLKPQMNGTAADAAGERYYITVTRAKYFGMNIRKIDSEKQSIPIRGTKLSFDRELSCGYTASGITGDGRGGAYIVGTRTVTQEDTGGKLAYDGHIQSFDDSVMLFYIEDLASAETVRCADIEAPYEEEGAEGIWSCARIHDVFTDGDGKLNVIYSVWHSDLDDADRRGREELAAETLKTYRAVLDGAELLSKEEIKIDGADTGTSFKIVPAADGTEYIAACNLQNSYPYLRFGDYPEGGEAKITVYCSSGDGWKPAAEKTLGDFAAEGFSVSGSADGDTVSCIVFTSENDVRSVWIAFTEK